MSPTPHPATAGAALVLGGALLACTGDRPPPSPPVPDPPVDPPGGWPHGSRIEDVGVHPTRPWLAAAMTDGAAERGAVVVFDTAAATIHAITPLEGYVGWSDDHILAWHPDGRRLVTNVETNGLAVIDDGALVGAAFPDDTRDHGVEAVWIGDRLYVDTGALFEMAPGRRFAFDDVDHPPLQDIGWNASIGAVVGRLDVGLAAYDPIHERLVYRAPLDAYGDRGHVRFSPDRRWAVRQQSVSTAIPGERYLDVRDKLLFVDADTGRVVGLRDPSSPLVEATRWGPGGVLAVASKVHVIGGPGRDFRLEVFRDGERGWVTDLGSRRVVRGYAPGDLTAMAWSPSGRWLAVLLDGDEVRVIDRDSGAVRTSFPAPAPDKAGLVWTDEEHIVRVGTQFVGSWTLDGRKVAEWRPVSGD